MMGTQRETREKMVLIFCGAVVLHGILAWLGYLPYKAQNPGTSLLHIFQRLSQAGDAEHYLFLAQNGYQSSGDKANLIVFYPLYPLLVGLAAKIFFFGNYILAGFAISYGCAGVAAGYLYKLIRQEYGEEGALAGVLAFLLYPFMIFTMGIYTEGLFLMLTVMGLYYIRRHNWLLVGIVGFLAALARVQGMLLFAPALYEYIRYKFQGKRNWKEYVKVSDLAMLGIPGGFGIYLCINRVVQGDFFAFIKHEAAPPWYMTTQWINANLAKDYNMAQNYGMLGYIIYWVQIVLFFFTIAVLVYGVKRKTATCFIVYGGIYTCFTYLAGWMISGGRYMMGCIPLFIVFASIKDRMVRSLVLCVETALCMFYTILFIQGQAIM